MMDLVDAEAVQHVRNSFPYTHLPNGQIRLLTISVNGAGALALSLTHHVYDADLAYDALSYAWAPPDAPICAILCMEKPLYLSVDLFAAIKCLAALNIDRPIWIDYICINQSDEEDKAWQVPLMGQYYSKAKEVWIWLGQSSTHDALAMMAMSDLAGKLPALTPMQPITDEWLKKSKLPLKYDILWDSIDSLFSRKWFDRLWTMQEFALATTATFFCGRYTVSGPEVVGVADNLLRLGLTSLTRKNRIPEVGYKDGYHFYTFAKRYWEAREKNGSMTLDLALQLGRFKKSEGTNEHDRVYAVLGVLDSSIYTQINARYSIPYSEMYVKVGKLSLQNSKNLEILAQCQSKSRPPGLPSWCPNWSAENEAAPFFYNYYFAGFLPGTLGSPHVEFPKGTNHLLIEGVCITTADEVATFSEKWDVEPVSMQKFQYTSRWINECLLKARAALGIASSTIPEAFLRTLIADVFVGQTGHSNEQLQDMWASVVQLMEELMGNMGDAPLEPGERKLAYDFLDSVFHACRFRRFFVTRDSRLALGPDRTRFGDKVVIFKNACMPFILRERGNGQLYELLGPAYVRGLMMGQVFSLAKNNQWEVFQIV